MKYDLAFIGFGEAAYNLALGLKSEGLSSMAAYDSCASDPGKGTLIRNRAGEAGVPLISLDEACKEGRFILSLNSAVAAEAVASEIMPTLNEGQVFVDMNSASPMTMEAIDHVPRADGVFFCDAAVMGAFPKKRHKTPMYLSGDGAAAFADAFFAYGMNLTVLDARAGSASALKMLKSVIMKGLPQLMFESYSAAYRYGVLDELVGTLSETLDGRTVEELSDTFIARTMIHAVRRAEEMREAARTLEAVGVDASMTEAAAGKLEKLAAVNWKEKLPADGKVDFREAVALFDELDAENA